MKDEIKKYLEILSDSKSAKEDQQLAYTEIYKIFEKEEKENPQEFLENLAQFKTILENILAQKTDN